MYPDAGEGAMPVSLATTYHDPEDRMYDQLAATLPVLARTFAGMAVHALGALTDRAVLSLERFTSRARAGARLQR
jgi:hypothetical protein